MRVIDSGADLADSVPDVSGSVVWTQDASAFYYVRLDQNHRPAGVFRHRLGTPASADVRVFAEADPGLFISVGRHASGRFGDISAHDHETSEVWLIDLAPPEPSRRSLPRAKPASNTKLNTIPLSMAGRH